MEKLRTILLFGPPGIGKGTQGARLGKLPQYLHFSTGDMFRGLDFSTDIGQEVKSYTDRRELVPDELTMRLFQVTIERYIQENKFDPSKQTLLLDGLPRNEDQVGLVNNIVNVCQIIYFVVDDNEVLIQRIQKRAEEQGRVDDQNPDVIRRGLEVYQEATAKVIEKYRQEIVLKIDAMGEIEDIYQKIVDSIIK